jgi:lipoprotein-anchoring transpeptidase ErfK/SrfK
MRNIRQRVHNYDIIHQDALSLRQGVVIVFVALVLMLLLAGSAPAAQEPPAKPARPVTSAEGAAPRAAAKSEAPDWLDIQVRLDRLALSPGEIDGAAGRNSREALKAFQERHGLSVTGRPDSATLDALLEASPEPALTTYTITEADTKGPFTPEIPGDLVEQGSLERLAYRDVREMLAERFHASAALLGTLNPGAKWAAGEAIQVPAVAALELPKPGARDAAAAPPHPATEIVVSDTTKTLTARGADGKILLHAPVTVGSENDPLPIGEWQILGVFFQPTFHYNPDLFWDADPSHAKTVIKPGPNNPVGLVWIDLSKEHYGLHGTPEPGRVGHTESHGCIRLTNWDAVRLASLVTKGTKVVFRK